MLFIFGFLLLSFLEVALEFLQILFELAFKISQVLLHAFLDFSVTEMTYR